MMYSPVSMKTVILFINLSISTPFSWKVFGSDYSYYLKSGTVYFKGTTVTGRKHEERTTTRVWQVHMCNDMFNTCIVSRLRQQFIGKLSLKGN